MAAPRNTVCEPWCTPDQLACRDAGASGDEAASNAIAVASDLLWRLSAFQFPGECGDTARPCLRGATGLSWWFPGDPAPSGYRSLCGGVCSCGAGLAQVELPGPVVAVTEVVVDGLILDEAAYRVDDHRFLVRVDGERWPACQRLDLPSSEPGTWEVTWTHGERPPPSGERAAADLACWYLQRGGSQGCDLDEVVRTLQRQNVTYEVNPTDDSSPASGLPPTVRAFLRAVNPKGMVARPRVWSPDTDRRLRYAGT
ncbi:MAG TPA: hypothetical protein VGB14_16325 [Acidimicrobiales bacterium]|jgi:hypothetical protein